MAILKPMTFIRQWLTGSVSTPWRWLIVVTMTLFLLGDQAASSADEISKEDQIKAAFIYNFTKFITWPSQHPASSGRTFVIGVLGEASIATELEKIARGRKIDGRLLEVRRLHSADEARSIHVLFVPAGEESRISNRLDLLHSAGVLTIGETERFAAHGGIITFRTAADKIRFEINRDAATRAGLKISPQLLKLAISTRQGQP